jgi:ketosteroid isomerase-like protein
LEANSAYLEQEAKAMENFQILGYEQAWQEVRITGDYAYELGTVQTRIGPMNPGPEVDTTYNMMRILKKQPDGSWRIYRAIWNTASVPKGPEKPTETPAEKPPAEDRLH